MWLENAIDARPFTVGDRRTPGAAGVPDCPECARLLQQAQVAHLSGDRSRLTDVRVFLARHEKEEHPSG